MISEYPGSVDKRKLLHRRVAAVAFAALVLVSAITPVSAQILQYMDIGRLQAAFAGNYYEGYEHTRSIFTNDMGRENWLFWPAEYARMDRDNDPQGLLAAFGLYLTIPNFTDQNGEHHSYYHAAAWGGRGPHDHRIKMADQNTLIKWDATEVSVDGISRILRGSERLPPIPSEMIIQNITHSEIGLTITRQAYGWSMDGYNDFIIVEFILENTGKVMRRIGFNEQEVVVSGWPQPLNDVWFALCYAFQPSALGCQHIGNWGDVLQPGMGHDARHEYLGETFGQPGQSTEDSLRALISWDGDAEPIGYDDTGNPHVLTGLLLSPQYVGVAILHADRSPSDNSDDPAQPLTTAWRGEYRGRYAFDQTQWGPPNLEESTVYQYISSGRRDHILPDQQGLDNPGEDHGFFLGFGPYDFGPNESLRIVTAYAAGGISRHKAIEVGERWKAGEISDEEKNATLATGRDSLMAAFSQAKRMFEMTNGLTGRRDDLLAPPPPRRLTVTSEINQVRLVWNGSTSEGASDFAGYRLYRNHRAEVPPHPPSSLADTLFVKIMEWGIGTDNPAIVNEYVDTSITPLWDYTYTLTAFDTDGNESGLSYMLFPDVMARPAWPPDYDSPLDKVMVVPNPHINKSRGWGVDEIERRIMFVGLPPECTIKIYTQSGNLVQVLEHRHNPGQGETGQEMWDQETLSNQTVASGVYIYTVESDIGNAMGTLVIIR